MLNRGKRRGGGEKKRIGKALGVMAKTPITKKMKKETSGLPT